MIGLRRHTVQVVAHEAGWVVLVEGRAWSDYLFFRDQLRQDAALRESYTALKAQLVRAHGDDRAAYTAAKAEFIRGVLDRAHRAGAITRQ